jgi:hypothetical protein
MPMVALFGALTRPSRPSSIILSKLARLEAVEDSILDFYRAELKVLGRVSDHALLEISRRLLTKGLKDAEKAKLNEILYSRLTIEGLINFNALGNL